ncbi:cation:proton antiporter [bacterium]|nr:cation:proton antiporter [bacterium]
MNTLIIILIVMIFACLFRVWRGPTIPDRMVAIDIFGVLVAGICALLAVTTKLDYLMDIALAWIFVSFIGTIALAKYLSGRTFDE